jgi:hypothetical protein
LRFFCSVACGGALQPKTFFEDLDLQPRILELPVLRRYLLLQLRDNLSHEGLRMRRKSRLRRRAHDVYLIT